MATKVETVLTDDLDQGLADETVSFGLDGTSYEIDLSKANARELREMFGDYIEAARKPAGVKVAVQRTDKAVVQAMRAWAAANGFQLANRGRIPGAVVSAYHAAN